MGVTSHHLYHGLLIRNKSQIVPGVGIIRVTFESSSRTSLTLVTCSACTPSLHNRKPLLHAIYHTGLCRQLSGDDEASSRKWPYSKLPPERLPEGSAIHTGQPLIGLGGQGRGVRGLPKGVENWHRLDE